MTERDMLDFKINLVLAKSRNLWYYRTIDTRERATYIHAVRRLRKQLIDVLNEIPNVPGYLEIKNYLLKMIRAINPKIKTDECTSFILNDLALILRERGLI